MFTFLRLSGATSSFGMSILSESGASATSGRFGGGEFDIKILQAVEKVSVEPKPIRKNQ
jgi:hypothetical protein